MTSKPRHHYGNKVFMLQYTRDSTCFVLLASTNSPPCVIKAGISLSLKGKQWIATQRVCQKNHIPRLSFIPLPHHLSGQALFWAYHAPYTTNTLLSHAFSFVAVTVRKIFEWLTSLPCSAVFSSVALIWSCSSMAAITSDWSSQSRSLCEAATNVPLKMRKYQEDGV